MIILLIIIGLISLDQVVKFLVVKNIYNSSVTILDGVLNITYIENRGAAFGLGNGRVQIFIIVNLILIIGIAKFILCKKDELSTEILVSLALILAGGIGNLIDRIFRGFVVDYIDFSPLVKYPVFNIADICVVLGCIIVGINLIINTIKERKEND